VSEESFELFEREVLDRILDEDPAEVFVFRENVQLNTTAFITIRSSQHFRIFLFADGKVRKTKYGSKDSNGNCSWPPVYTWTD
jgi:hypothetical protein